MIECIKYLEALTNSVQLGLNREYINLKREVLLNKL